LGELASSQGSNVDGTFVPDALALCIQKNSALTPAQARPLVARVLEDEQERKPDILSAIADHQQGNYAAYCSYR